MRKNFRDVPTKFPEKRLADFRARGGGGKKTSPPPPPQPEIPGWFSPSLSRWRNPDNSADKFSRVALPLYFVNPDELSQFISDIIPTAAAAASIHYLSGKYEILIRERNFPFFFLLLP